MLEKELRSEERSTLFFAARMEEAAEDGKRKRCVNIAWRRVSSVGVRWHVGAIRIIMITNPRRPCANYRASLVPCCKSEVDGSHTSRTQRSSSEAKDYSLGDSIGS